MVTEFLPTSDLEQQLLGAQQGTVTIPALIETLLRSQVVALFNTDISAGGKQFPPPLAITGPTGAPMLVMFTSLNRVQTMTASFPEYRFGMLVQFRWLAKGIAEGVGLVINPGWDVGIEVLPHGVAQLKSERLDA